MNPIFASCHVNRLCIYIVVHYIYYTLVLHTVHNLKIIENHAAKYKYSIVITENKTIQPHFLHHFIKLTLGTWNTLYTTAIFLPKIKLLHIYTIYTIQYVVVPVI